MSGKHVEYERQICQIYALPLTANIATKTYTECSRQNLLVGQGKIKSDLWPTAFDYLPLVSSNFS